VDDESVGDLHVGTVVVDVQDMGRAVAFWTAALGYRTRESERDLEFCVVGHVDLE
jgi:catechol-2,3-dioxygenase